MEEDSDIIKYHYTFAFDEHRDCQFEILISKQDISLIEKKKESYPSWAELDSFKCPNCPLDSDEVKYCPMAASISDPVEAFLDIVSYEEVDVTVECDERTYRRKGALQEGLSSLMGLYMATSGCPNLKKLRPMAANHLPFASVDETIYRVLSTYALAQAMRKSSGLESDEGFDGLMDLYENIGVVNEQFCQRLMHLQCEDSNVNAVLILNNFAQFVPLSIDEDMLNELKSSLFKGLSRGLRLSLVIP